MAKIKRQLAQALAQETPESIAAFLEATKDLGTSYAAWAELNVDGSDSTQPASSFSVTPDQPKPPASPSR